MRTYDSLLGDVELGRGVTSIASLSDTVDLVVDGGTVVVTVLTSTGNSLSNIVSGLFLGKISPNWKFDAPIAREPDARLQYKRPSSDPCVSSLAASWCPILM